MRVHSFDIHTFISFAFSYELEYQLLHVFCYSWGDIRYSLKLELWEKSVGEQEVAMERRVALNGSGLILFVYHVHYRSSKTNIFRKSHNLSLTIVC